MSFKTEQEDFWAGEFGNEYIQRNEGNHFIASNLALFSKVLARTHHVRSAIEFGANIGQNLKAISHLIPGVELSAIEINPKASEILKSKLDLELFQQSILEFEPSKSYDFVFSKGVLIHLNPDELPAVYQKLYQSSARYICLVEYFNPVPVQLEYRGHQDKLFKRDFAGDMMDLYPDLELVDYGFTYRRDPNFRLDNSTWFLLQKKPS